MFPLRIAGDVARMEAVDELLNPHLDHELLIIRTIICSGNEKSTSIVCGGTLKPAFTDFTSGNAVRIHC